MVAKSICTLLRTALVLLTTAGFVHAQQRTKSPPNNADNKYPVPVQTYAVIDISGSTTDDVDLVALDDDNKAAFSFGTGLTRSLADCDPQFSGNAHFTDYHIYTWQNGQLSLEQVVPCAQRQPDIPNDPPDPNLTRESWKILEPKALQIDGSIYGTNRDLQVGVGGNPVYHIPGAQEYYQPFGMAGKDGKFTYSDFTSLWGGYGVEFSAVSGNGIMALISSHEYSWGCIQNGTARTVFGPYGSQIGVTVCPDLLIPLAVNNQSWALGYPYMNTNLKLWKGSGDTLIDITSGYVGSFDLND